MFDLRDLTLGPQFQPKVQDIPTPDLLTAKGAPDDLLRLVSLSAAERTRLLEAFGTESSVKNTALLICKTLRYRDGGGDDGKGTYVYGKLDANGVSVPNYVDADALVAQDSELIGALAPIVKAFSGFGVAAQVADAKNDSKATQSSNGGTASPSTSDVSPSESASLESETTTS